MQTFLPYPSFNRSAAVLDPKRLWKQVLEADGILRVIRGERHGYRDHPAVQAWIKHPESLTQYRDAMVQAWLFQRLKNAPTLLCCIQPTTSRMPPWFDNPEVFAAHRACLLNKDPKFYGQYDWMEKPLKKFPWELLKERRNEK